MKRLTIRNSDGTVSQPTTTSIEAMFYRLAAYEDTGLEPEEIKVMIAASMEKAIAEIKEFEGVSIDRLRELAEADKEGRCVVLPCKLHTNLFIIDNNQVNHVVVESFHQWTSGCWKLSAHIDKEFQHWKGYEIGFEAIGKTIFLTREAAEAALKEREQNE